jgi:hypothetical protein
VYIFLLVGKEEHALPYLLFLQGGPGFESPRPVEASGWLKKACEVYRVILLDQVNVIVCLFSFSKLNSFIELVCTFNPIFNDTRSLVHILRSEIFTGLYIVLIRLMCC